MNTEEAVALRKQLELDVFALLDRYERSTGLTPTEIEVQRVDVTRLGPGTERSVVLSGVRITVQL